MVVKGCWRRQGSPEFPRWADTSQVSDIWKGCGTQAGSSKSPSAGSKHTNNAQKHGSPAELRDWEGNNKAAEAAKREVHKRGPSRYIVQQWLQTEEDAREAMRIMAAVQVAVLAERPRVRPDGPVVKLRKRKPPPELTPPRQMPSRQGNLSQPPR